MRLISQLNTVQLFSMVSTLCCLPKHYMTIEALLLLKDKEEAIAHSFHS